MSFMSAETGPGPAAPHLDQSFPHLAPVPTTIEPVAPERGEAAHASPAKEQPPLSLDDALTIVSGIASPSSSFDLDADDSDDDLVSNEILQRFATQKQREWIASQVVHWRRAIKGRAQFDLLAASYPRIVVGPARSTLTAVTAGAPEAPQPKRRFDDEHLIALLHPRGSASSGGAVAGPSSSRTSALQTAESSTSALLETGDEDRNKSYDAMDVDAPLEPPKPIEKKGKVPVKAPSKSSGKAVKGKGKEQAAVNDVGDESGKLDLDSTAAQQAGGKQQPKKKKKKLERDIPEVCKTAAHKKDVENSTRWYLFWTCPVYGAVRLDVLEQIILKGLALAQQHALNADQMARYILDELSRPGMGYALNTDEPDLDKLCAGAKTSWSPKISFDKDGKKKKSSKPSGSDGRQVPFDFDAGVLFRDWHSFKILLAKYSAQIEAASARQAQGDFREACIGVVQLHQCVHLGGPQLSERDSSKPSGWAGNGPTERAAHAEVEMMAALSLLNGELNVPTDARCDCAGPAIRVSHRLRTGESPTGTTYASFEQQRLDQLEFKYFYRFLYLRYGLRVRGVIAKGAEAQVAVGLNPFGHALAPAPGYISVAHDGELFGYDMLVYGERHGKFVTSTTSREKAAILLMKTSMHYVDVQREFEGTYDPSERAQSSAYTQHTDYELLELIYKDLATRLGGDHVIEPFESAAARIGLNPSRLRWKLYKVICAAEAKVRSWSLREYGASAAKDDSDEPQPEPEATTRTFSAVLAGSGLAQVITAARRERDEERATTRWGDLRSFGQKWILDVLCYQVDGAKLGSPQPDDQVSMRELLSVCGSLNRDGIFGKTSSLKMEKAYRLPKKLTNFLHGAATTLETRNEGQKLDEAHKFLKWQTYVKVRASSITQFRTTAPWLEIINGALPETEKILIGAREQSASGCVPRFGAMKALETLTVDDSIMKFFGNSLKTLLDAKGLELNVVDEIAGSTENADYFKAEIWQPFLDKVGPELSMSKVYSMHSVGGLAAHNMRLAREADSSRPFVNDTVYWYAQPEGQDKNWSFVRALAGAFIDGLIYVQKKADFEIEVLPPDVDGENEDVEMAT